MSEFNITIEGGTSKRLPTAGKYCEKDIIVTATGSAETMVGWWELNEEIDDTTLDGDYSIKISKADLPGHEIVGLRFALSQIDLLTPDDWIGFYDAEEWYLDRVITILEEPTDSELVEWIKANARKLTYDECYEEGEKAILSTYVDWTVATTSSICIVDFYSETDYYAHIYCCVGDTITGENYYEEFVLEPYGSYTIDTEEVIGTPALSGEWSVNVTIMGFSKDGEL